VVPVVEAQLAAHGECAAAVVVARARDPAILTIHHLAPPRHVERDDRGATLRVTHEHAVRVLLVVIARVERRVRGRDAGEAVIGERHAVALLVVVPAAVEPEQRLRHGQRGVRRPVVDQLVVWLEEVVALAVVRERVEPPVAVGVAGDEAVHVVGVVRQVGEVRLLRTAVEVDAERLAAEHAPCAQHVRP
jgi:hypothetical protein